MVLELYENLGSKGVLIITDLKSRLGKVDAALAALYEVLTKNNIQESLVIGHEKYKGVTQLSNQKVSRWYLL